MEGRQPRAILLIRFELLYPAIPLPKLDVTTVDQLARGFHGRVVAGTIQIDCPEETAVTANKIRAIMGHVMHRYTKQK